MTVREAFAKAGYPVPEKAMLFVAYQQKPNHERRAEWIAVFDAGICPVGKRFFLGARAWMTDEPFSNSRHWVITRIDLSSLPAIDAYDALPDVVKKVVTK